MLTQSSAEFQREFELYLSDPKWDWTWFVTQTFDPKKPRNHFHEKRGFPRNLCKHSWEYFLAIVGEYSPMVYGFWFLEPHKSGVPHWHAMVHVSENPLGSATPGVIWREMFKRYGRSQIRPIYKADSELTAARLVMYLTKYVAKEARRTHDTWDFGGLLGGESAEIAEFVHEIGLNRADFR